MDERYTSAINCLSPKLTIQSYVVAKKDVSNPSQSVICLQRNVDNQARSMKWWLYERKIQFIQKHMFSIVCTRLDWTLHQGQSTIIPYLSQLLPFKVTTIVSDKHIMWQQQKDTLIQVCWLHSAELLARRWDWRAHTLSINYLVFAQGKVDKYYFDNFLSAIHFHIGYETRN